MNLVWQVRKRLSLGLEGLYGFKEEKSGADGDAFRIQMVQFTQCSIDEGRIEYKPSSGPERVAASRLPINCVLFEVGVNSAAYGRIEVCGAEAFE